MSGMLRTRSLNCNHSMRIKPIVKNVALATLWGECCGAPMSDFIDLAKPSLTDRTTVRIREVLAGRRRGCGSRPAVRGARGDRLDRLYGPRQFRDQHPGRRRVRLRAALGGAAGEPDRHAVPGAVRQARHRHRPEPGRNVPRAIPSPGRLCDVGRQRGRRDGDRPRRVSRRRHRALAAVQAAAARRHGGHRPWSPMAFCCSRAAASARSNSSSAPSSA